MSSLERVFRKYLLKSSAARKLPRASPSGATSPGAKPSAREISVIGSGVPWLAMTSGKVLPGAMVAGVAMPMMVACAWCEARSRAEAAAVSEKAEGDMLEGFECK